MRFDFDFGDGDFETGGTVRTKAKIVDVNFRYGYSPFTFERHGFRFGPTIAVSYTDLEIDLVNIETGARETIEETFPVPTFGFAGGVPFGRVVISGHFAGFYFNADSRVDFRELVRRLATQYHTRIEMRQVGARDEARLVADYERCGQRCCCQQFLQYLRPVSMRMAKTQKATLDPTKISGRCGRLKC